MFLVHFSSCFFHFKMILLNVEKLINNSLLRYCGSYQLYGLMMTKNVSMLILKNSDELFIPENYTALVCLYHRLNIIV